MMRGAEPADHIAFKYAAPQAEAARSEWIADATWEKLLDRNWKARLEGARELQQVVLGSDGRPAPEPELVLKLASIRPGWKETNFQVVGVLLEVIQHLLKAPGGFDAAAAAIAAPLLVDKLSDNKNRAAAGAALVAVADQHGLPFVLSLSYPLFAAAKAPRVIQDNLTWLLATLDACGVSGVNTRQLVEHLKSNYLSHSNQGVRNGALAIVVLLRQRVGPDVQLLLQDQSASLLATLQSEIARSESALGEPESKPESVAPRPKPAAASAPVPQSKPAPRQESAEDLIPRTDLSTMATAQLVENLDSSNWKLRKEALDEVQAAVKKACGRLKGALGDLQRPLGARLGDSNKKLVMQTLEIVAGLAGGMGKAFSAHERAFVPGIAACLADKNAQVRAAAAAALQAVHDAAGGSIRTMLPLLIAALDGSSSPLLRGSVLEWLAPRLGDPSVVSQLPQPRQDLAGLVKPSLGCLLDRDATVRRAAQAVVPFLVAHLGFAAVESACGSLGNKAACQAAAAAIEPFRGAETELADSLATASGQGAPRGSNASLLSQPSTTSAARRTTRSRPGAAPSKSASASAKPSPATAAPSSMSLAASMGELSMRGSSSNSLAPERSVAPDQIFATMDPRAKERRMDARGQLRWSVDTQRSDLAAHLADQAQGAFGPEMYALLFSTDHYKERDHMQGMAVLDEALRTAAPGSALVQGTIANLDLVLKYATLRLTDTNTSMALRTLGLLEHLLSALDASDYHLSEHEAAALLPFLLARLGDSKESIRARCAGLLRLLCRLYPASKLVHHLQDALGAKNARVRIEVLEQLAQLVQRNGVGVMAPARVLPVVATHIGDRDAAVRNAALSVMVQTYLQIGDQLYGYISLSDKEGTMLGERLKRLPGAPSADAAPRARPSSAGTSRTAPGSAARAGRPETPAKAPPSRPATPSKAPVRREFHLNLEKLGIVAPAGAAEAAVGDAPGAAQLPGAFPAPAAAPTGAAESIALLGRTTDPAAAVDALKQLDRLMERDSLAPEHVDALVSALAERLRAAAAAPPAAPSEQRVQKHVINVLLGCASRPSLIRAVSREQLHALLRTLLLCMLEPAAPASSTATPDSTRACSFIMIRILENYDRNASFAVLLELLFESHTAMRAALADATAGEEARRCASFTELTMKCLWKLTKLLRDLLAQNAVDPGQLFFDIHTFLVRAPPDEWKEMLRERAPNQDMPYRTVKTILHEMVSHIGAPLAAVAQARLSPGTHSTALAYVYHALGKRRAG